jgi:glycine/D-amino acid oxidase-like deaminating enzyme
MTTELGDSCGFSRCRSLYFASESSHQQELQEEYACRRHFGFSLRYLSSGELAEMSSIRAAAALLTDGDGQIDPLRFTSCILRRAAELGLRVFSNTPILAISETADDVALQTATGRIRARALVIATGYEAFRHVPSIEGRLQTTYALATAPREAPGWPERCLIWETARPYFYGRRTQDGRALVGGADTAFSDDHQDAGVVGRKTKQLMKRVSELFPQAQLTADYAWGGTFAETGDGLALIGKVPQSARKFAALGYGGNGITFSMIAGRLMADLYLGHKNADAAVFAFGR